MADRRSSSRPTLRNDAARALAGDAGWHARLAARQVSAALDQGLADAGLSSAQFGLLCLVASAPDDTLGGLAQRAGPDQSTMSRHVDQLARALWRNAHRALARKLGPGLAGHFAKASATLGSTGESP
ncbi:MAG: winged helix-turn-helix transcriptional regulator [Burkholderiales bacterium]|nr:winged helix-turn-helix transcriptional regulator [Burkholderiales bacterium]